MQPLARGRLGLKRLFRRQYAFLAAMLLILALILTGFIMVFRVFRQYEARIIGNEDRQLAGLARSVDRSISGYLQQIAGDLEYPLQHDGIAAAEQSYRETGDTAPLTARLEETLLAQHPLTYDLLCLDGDTVLCSMRGGTGYRFPAGAGLDGEVAIGPCYDGAGELYLSFTAQGGSGLQYAVLVRLSDFYRTVAGDLIAGTEDRILLMDAGGRTVVYQTAQGITAEPVENGRAAAFQQEELDALLDCRDRGSGTALSYQARPDGARSYAARLAAIPAAGNNGVFVVAATMNYETVQRPLRMSAIRLTAYSSMIVVGILLLAGCILLAVRRGARTQQEVRTLRQQNLALEEATRKSQALAHHQRLEIIGTLTSSIAHEFNNLLTPIMGYSLMVLEKLPPEGDENYDHVLAIYEASRKAKTIISRLSDLSRKNTALTFQYLEPDVLAQRALDIAAPAKPPKVEVVSRLQCRHLWIHGNEIQLSQMLLNLILNACQAMEAAGGTLTLSTAREGQTICFRVADTGPGIDPAAREKIFEPFFTTKERGKGTGLGLAIVQQVAKEHHGSVEVESEPGQGTTMTVRLPLPARGEDPEPSPS